MRFALADRRVFCALLIALAGPVGARAPAAGNESDALVAPEAIETGDFFVPGLAPVVNPAGRDLTIVYFMDYECPSCRRYSGDVERVMAGDRGVRWIVRDIPRLSPQSMIAARLALASTYQGRHAAFHRALMAVKGPLGDAKIRAAAQRARVDWPRLLADLAAHGVAIDAQIARNHALADATGISATPAFIVGDTLANGALDEAGLRAEIADARARRNPAPPAATAAPAPEPAVMAATERVTAAPPPPAPAPAAPRAASEVAAPTPAPAARERRWGLAALLAVAALLGGLWWRGKRG